MHDAGRMVAVTPQTVSGRNACGPARNTAEGAAMNQISPPGAAGTLQRWLTGPRIGGLPNLA
jgi:hypothetical protein